MNEKSSKTSVDISSDTKLQSIARLQEILDSLTEGNIEESFQKIFELNCLPIEAIVRNVIRFSNIRPKTRNLYTILFQKIHDTFHSKYNFRKILRNFLFAEIMHNDMYFTEYCYRNNLTEKVTTNFYYLIPHQDTIDDEDKRIIELLSFDDIDGFQKLASCPDFEINKLRNFIPGNKYNFMNIPVICFSAAFGATKCFKFLLLNHANIYNGCNIEKFAIIGGNTEIIRLLEQQGHQIYSVYKTAIKYHRYDIYDWIIENHPEIHIESSVYISNEFLHSVNKLTGDPVELFSKASHAMFMELVEHLIGHYSVSDHSFLHYSGSFLNLYYVQFVITKLLEYNHGPIVLNDIICYFYDAYQGDSYRFNEKEVQKEVGADFLDFFFSNDSLKIGDSKILFEVCKFNDIKTLRRIVDHGSSEVDTKELNSWRNPYSNAIKFGSDEFINLFFEIPGVEESSKKLFSVVNAIDSKKSIETIKFLMDKYETKLTKDECLSLIIAACQSNNNEVISLVLDYHLFDFNIDENLPLRAMEELIKCGNDIGAKMILEKDKYHVAEIKRPHLMFKAVESGSLEILDMLYDVPCSNYLGSYPNSQLLIFSSMCNQPHIIEYLLKKPDISINYIGNDVLVQNNIVETRKKSCALIEACKRGYHECARILMQDERIDVNIKPYIGSPSPLKYALKSGSAEILFLLIKRPDIKTNKGILVNTLKLALAEKHLECVKFVLEDKNLVLTERQSVEIVSLALQYFDENIFRYISKSVNIRKMSDNMFYQLVGKNCDVEDEDIAKSIYLE